MITKTDFLGNIGNLKIIIYTLLKDMPDRHSNFYKVGLGTEVLRVLIGNYFVNKNIFTSGEFKPNNLDKREDYFKSSEKGIDWNQSVFQLSEFIYNLELNNIENLDLLIKRFNLGDDIYGLYNEVEFGSFLLKKGIDFRYLSDNDNFTFDIETKNFGNINIELKNKTEFTNLSINTLNKTISKAKKQLPTNGPGLIFIKLPYNWFDDLGKLNDIVFKSFNNVFKTNPDNHILGVFFFWTEKEKISQATKFKNDYHLIINKNSKFFNNNYEKLLLKLVDRKLYNENYIFFNKLVDDLIK